MPVFTSQGVGAAKGLGFSAATSSGPTELWAPLVGAVYSTNTGVDQYPRGARFSPYTATPSSYPQNNMWAFGSTQWSTSVGIAASILRASASDASQYGIRSAYEWTQAQDANVNGSKCTVGDLKFLSGSTSQIMYWYGQSYFSYSSSYGTLVFAKLDQQAASSYSATKFAQMGDLGNLTPTMAVNYANGAFAFSSSNSMNVYGAKPTSQTSAQYFRIKFTATTSQTNNVINFAAGTTNDTGGSFFACSSADSSTSIYLIGGIIRSSLKGLSIVRYNTTNDTITWTKEITNATYNIDSFTLWQTPTTQLSAPACMANYGCADSSDNLYVASCVKYAAGNWRPIIFKFDSSGNLLSQWEYNLTAGNRQWKVGSLVYNQQTSSLYMMAMNDTDTSKVYVIKLTTTGSYVSQTVIDCSQSSSAGAPYGSISVNTTGQYFLYGGTKTPATGGTNPSGISVLLPTDGSKTGTYGTGSTTVASVVVTYDSTSSTWTVNTSSTTGTSTSQTYTVSAGTYYATGDGATGSGGVLNTVGYI